MIKITSLKRAYKFVFSILLVSSFLVSSNTVKAADISGRDKDLFTYKGTVLTGYSDKGEKANKKDIVVPNGVTEIARGVFSKKALNSVSLPSSLKKICFGAFSYNNLTSIKLPVGLTHIESFAFSNNKLGQVEIPSGVGLVSEFSFSDNNISRLVINNGIKTLGDGAFSRNILTKVTIPSSVKGFGKGVFAHNSLVDVNILAEMKTIPSGFFAYNKLVSVKVPDSVESISGDAFIGNPGYNKDRQVNIILNYPLRYIENYKANASISVDKNDKFYDEHIRNRFRLFLTQDSNKRETVTNYSYGYIFNGSSMTNRSVNRTFGDDRTLTSIKVSQKNYKNSQSVIVVRGDNFPDALSASLLAKAKDSPILLNVGGELDNSILDEIKRLKAKEAIIVGGNEAVSLGVENKLKATGLSVKRISGENRYDTSAKVAIEISKLIEISETAMVVSGEEWADALTSAPFATRLNLPILLISSKGVPKEISNAIDLLGIESVYVAGGELRIPQSVVGQLPKLVKRLSGPNRYATATQIAKEGFAGVKNTYLASGESFADALVIGHIAAKEGRPILLTSVNNLGSDTEKYIRSSSIGSVEIIGGNVVISNLIERQLRK